MGPLDLFGAGIQYFKSLPFSGKWAKFQPPLVIAFTAILGTGFFIWSTPNALALDWRTFVDADWRWIQSALGTGAAIGLVAQSGVNLGALNAKNMAVPITNPRVNPNEVDPSRVNQPGH